MLGFNQVTFGRRAIEIPYFQYCGFVSELNTNFWVSLILGAYQTAVRRSIAYQYIY